MQKFEGQYVTNEKSHRELTGARPNSKTFCSQRMSNNKEMNRRVTKQQQQNNELHGP
jgi:hypothetical protein